MARTLCFIGLAALAVILFTGPAQAQVSSLTGSVIGEDGKPLQNAVILIERQDIKGNYKTKTNRKGEWFHAGLPLGHYLVKVEVNGKVVDQAGPVRTTLGEPIKVDFDLQAVKRRREAAERGELTEEQKRALTDEQRRQIEEQMAKRAEAIRKNKELNESFNAGMENMKAGNLEAAIEAFLKGAEIDPKQYAIWANMADCYSQLAAKKTGAERDELFQKGVDAYQKAIELRPEDSATYNNLGLLYAKAGKLDLAQEMLKKAASMDPAKASTYYYNLGAVLTNTGQLDGALEAFKMAVQANPDNADAQYQLGIALIGKATALPDGSIQPPEGTREAFEKYLALQPNGQYAEAARQMLATIGSKIETQYVNPDAKKKPTAKPKR